jgi:hypothetical protein
MLRRGSRHKQLLDDRKEKRKYWNLKGEAMARSLCRTRFENIYGPVVRDGRPNE